MKYLIPFWYWLDSPDDIDLSEGWVMVLVTWTLSFAVLLMIAGIACFITWSITMAEMRAIFIFTFLALLPNYWVSYQFYKKDKK